MRRLVAAFKCADLSAYINLAEFKGAWGQRRQVAAFKCADLSAYINLAEFKGAWVSGDKSPLLKALTSQRTPKQ